MSELLTLQEIKAFYDRLIHKPGYITTLKKSINEAKTEQILTYAKNVHQEAFFRYNDLLPVDSGFDFPPSPMFKDPVTLPTGEELPGFDQYDRLKYWLNTSATVIKILENGTGGHQPKRTLREIALQYVWENKIIDNKNKDQIAVSFPELNLRNGHKLYQYFNYYSDHSNRCFDNDDEEKNQRHLKIMLEAKKYLSNPVHIEQAEKEILEFKNTVKHNWGQIL